MRVRVDPDVCQGHTLCALAAPEIFLLREEDGHSFVVDEEVPPSMEEAVRRAAAPARKGPSRSRGEGAAPPVAVHTNGGSLGT